MNGNGFRNGGMILGVLLLCSPLRAADAAAEPVTWPFEIQVQHRPGTYWWCPGSAWDRESIDWNLGQLKEGGIGTVHIVPIYGAKGYEQRFLTFLSPEWIESLQYILKRADSLGLQVDMTTGTGWCFGGPGLPESHRDMTAKLDQASGKIKTTASRMVKRPAPGGAGHMLNPFSSDALAAYLERFDKAFDRCERLPRAQYHDSFEYSGNWCEGLPREFEQRRGYDLSAHLETLFGEEPDRDKAGRIKYDYRLTAAELHREFIEQWADWARSRGMLTRDQAHGSPANLLDVYAAAEIPETEMFGSPEFPIPGFRRDEQFCRPPDSDPRVCRLASSAAHVAHPPGKQLVSSESCTWMREHWHGTLGQMKLEIDLFLLAGINHVFYHGSCYSPKDAPWPGWFFYASTKVDWRNSVWRDMPLLNDYIARCQSVLQAGRPDNDVLLYWPIHDLWMEPGGLLKNLTVHRNDWMVKQPVGHVADALDRKGYAFDFVSDRMLDEVDYAKGRLAAPGGSYQALVVPRCRFMPAQTMRRLADLAEQGAVIVFAEGLPDDVPGYAGLPARRESFARHRQRLGGAIVELDVEEGLRRGGVRPEPLAAHGLRYVRRVTPDGHWYFIANHTGDAVEDWIELTRPFASAVRHDPLQGDSTLLPTRQAGQTCQVYLDIQPGQTLVVHASTVKVDAQPYVPMKPAGKPIALEGEWLVEFIEGGPTLPEAYRTGSLSCWTSAPDERARAFAGTARYTLRFDLPSQSDADEYLLDLGDVRESARVKINGQDAAGLFAIPMRARVGRFLQDGVNTIEIEVTNLAANRIRDLDLRQVDWKIMCDINIVNQHYRKFDASQWPLQPSGLLGRVTLQPLAIADPAARQTTER